MSHTTARRVAALSALAVLPALGVAPPVHAASATAHPALLAPRAAAVLLLQASRPFPVVRRGSSGQPVRSLQYLLRARGRTVVVDGAFGPATERAVRSFQSSRGLVADGVVGNLTWRALVVTVRLGSRGEAVRGVQDQAQFRNLSGDPSKGVAVDGIFGPRTEQFVRGFQQADGLAADGVVGPMTWQALIAGDLSF